jgi:AAA domain, putative AbiEii toxin, Type IV TA system
VGENNSGKSSILEGLHFLATGSWLVLQNSLMRRGWFYNNMPVQGQFIQYVNAKQSLLNWSALRTGLERLSIAAHNSTDCTKFEFEFLKPSMHEVLEPKGVIAGGDAQLLYRLLGAAGSTVVGQTALKAHFFKNNILEVSTPLIPLFDDSNIRLETINNLSQIMSSNAHSASRSHFIFSENNDLQPAIQAWSKIAFDEKIVGKIVQVLKFIQPDLVGFQLLQFSPQMHNTFFAKLKDVSDPIPLASLGDGIRRLLYILLAFPLAEKGLVFIDEIETGIHHSMMGKLWQMILEFAQAFDVQVFASTHSLDCVRSAGNLAADSAATQELSAHRIDSTRVKSIDYSFKELAESADLDEEIRGFGA